MENTKRNIVNSAENKNYAGTPILLSALAVLFLFEGEGIALGQAREGRQLVTAELMSDAANTEGPFTVGIRFTLEPDWYLYWKNPGDAGLPIDVQWELPAGWAAGDVQLPIPSKFVHDDVTAFGYKKEVILLATITPTPGSTRSLVKARLDWLVCRESCLRGGRSVSLDISQQSPESRAKASSLLKESRSRLPGTQKESGVLFQEARLVRDGEQWTIAVRFENGMSDEVEDYYPELTDGIFVDFKSIAVRGKELKFTFTRQDETIQSRVFRGLLVTKEFAYEVEIPAQFSSK